MWSLTDGRPITEELGYIPMPENIVKRVEDVLENQVQVAAN